MTRSRTSAGPQAVAGPAEKKRMPVPEHTDHAPAADDRAAGAPEVAMPAVFETLAAERRPDAAPDAAAALDAVADAPVQLAVFDFDGTSIAGNSPVLLFLDLAKHNLLANSVMLRILLWAAAYKFRLPQNESWVRSLVFSAFEGHPVEEVDQYLADFYDRDIAPLFRPEPTPPCGSMPRPGTWSW